MQRVTIDPHVALSIVDHHMRRADDADRVTGVVLGSTVKGHGDIRSFTPSFDVNMITLTQRACPNDLAVGWYATGFSAEDLASHVKLLNKISHPYFISVQLPCKEKPEIAFKCFVLATVNLSGGDETKVFREIPCTVASSDNATNVALDTMVSLAFPEVAAASDPTRVSATNFGAHAELDQIRANLKTSLAYVDDVIAGKREGDKLVGRALSEAMMANRAEQGAPTEEASGADETGVSQAMQDAMMLKYMSAVVDQQLKTLRGNANGLMLVQGHVRH